MKYCIFKHTLPSGNTVMLPVIFPEHINHCDVKMEGAELRSAGYLEMRWRSLIVDMNREAVSTGRRPHQEDSEYLKSAMEDAGTMMFAGRTDTPPDDPP